MSPPVLSRRFFARPAAEVARALLGRQLEFHGRAGRILEVEAYLAENDRAAHAFAGRTRRTEVLYGPPGHAYVYLIYGMYHCLNVVCEPEGVPGCVLIRAVEGFGDGPGKLTRAAGITLAENGCDLTRGPLRILDAARPVVEPVLVTPRIGIRQARELPLRFVLGGGA
jgi:DNA-3-methyladenine glycosylase